MGRRSLTSRVLLVTSVWIAIALVVIAVVISHLYRQSAERAFTDLLRAQLYNVINSVSIGKEGTLEGRPELGDLQFVQPKTGWYWIVDPLGDFKAPSISSISLGSASVPVADTGTYPFDNHYERFYRENDGYGNDVEVAETEVLLDNDGHAARFRVVGNYADVQGRIERFQRQLLLVFVIFGLGSLAVNAVAIVLGLRPLDAVRRSLEHIRAGKSEYLTGAFPREIEPLANEVNALIASNRRIVERARTQVGNLAHSLKTPIAVLLNEARRLDEGPSKLISAQVTLMQDQVQSSLDRARIAAQNATVLARAEPAPLTERLIRVMRRLHPDLDFALDIPPHLPALAMERQDVEEVFGNLLDNAGKFARSRVRLTMVEGEGPKIAVIIEDDGPGLAESQIAEALKRGRRLDETKPGTGLGLSIVDEIVKEYHGGLAFDRSPLGGLRATLTLPEVVERAT